MVRAYRLFTGADGNSHVQAGSIELQAVVAADSIMFSQTAAHSSLDWHNDPVPQYVITLSGTLEFTTRTGETFVVRPGEVLIAQDHTGTGHKWRLVDDNPWIRAYVVYQEGADVRFTPDAQPAQTP